MTIKDKIGRLKPKKYVFNISFFLNGIDSKNMQKYTYTVFTPDANLTIK